MECPGFSVWFFYQVCLEVFCLLFNILKFVYFFAPSGQGRVLLHERGAGLEAEAGCQGEPPSAVATQSRNFWDFPGGPVVRTPRFRRRERGFNPWLGN